MRQATPHRDHSQQSHNSRQQYPAAQRVVKTGGTCGHHGTGEHPGCRRSALVEPFARQAYSATWTRPKRVAQRTLPDLAGLKQTGRFTEIPPRHASMHGQRCGSPDEAARHRPTPPSRAHHGETIVRVEDGPDDVRRAGFRLGEEESRRAPDGGTAMTAGVTWERVDAEDGGLRACPSVDRSATPRLLGRSPLDQGTPLRQGLLAGPGIG